MKMKWIALTLVILTLCGACALAESTMTVRGVGVVKVDADQASVSLGVREIAGDVITAQSAVNEKIDAVISALVELGVGRDAISTNGIGIYPSYDYSEEERITGYNAYNNIYVFLGDVDLVGAVIDAAFAAGANSLDYVDFTAADTAEASDRALELAVNSAREKAQVLADAAGVRLDGILEITDSGDYGYDGNVLFARTEEADMGSGTQVLASQQNVTATVNITFAISDASK